MADVTVGRSVPLQPGQQPSASSISVVQATDHPPIAVFDAFEGSSEVKQDLLGNPRFGTPQLLFANVRRYDIDNKIWATKVDTNTNGRVQFDSAKSAARLSINGTSVLSYSSLQSRINFPYQPGRNMDTSFGVQCSRGSVNANVVIEFGAYDNFDGCLGHALGHVTRLHALVSRAETRSGARGAERTTRCTRRSLPCQGR